MKNRRPSLVLFAICLLLIASFAALLFHHHEEGPISHDCVVCRLAKTISCFIALSILFLTQLTAQAFSERPAFKPVLTSLPFSLQNRPPPLFS
jgi:hypothetical protein